MHVVSVRLSAVRSAYVCLAVYAERKSVLKFQGKRREYVTVEAYGRSNAQSWIAYAVVALMAVAASRNTRAVLFVLLANIGVCHKGSIRLYGASSI